MAYENYLNHQQWLETVAPELRQFVPSAIADWDAQADSCNKWSDLGWDERDALLQAQAAAGLGEGI